MQITAIRAIVAAIVLSQAGAPVAAQLVKSPVAVEDANGVFIGLATVDYETEKVYAWIQLGPDVLAYLVSFNPDRGIEYQGSALFESSDCTGPAYVEPRTNRGYYFEGTVAGPGKTLYRPNPETTVMVEVGSISSGSDDEPRCNESSGTWELFPAEPVVDLDQVLMKPLRLVPLRRP